MNRPNFNFESELWKSGLKFVGGCDEVGRGCFAGPVVASVVVFASDLRFKNNDSRIKINDSKQLTPKQREVADIWIKENAIAYGIGEVSVIEINKLGIVKATRIAMRKAVKATKIKIDHLLIDAFYLPNAKGLSIKKQTAIIKGDTLSVSIAAASILAKVYRDNLMNEIGSLREYSAYNWHKNKGYGTLHHRKTILKLGITKYHRTQFVNTFLSKSYLLYPKS